MGVMGGPTGASADERHLVERARRGDRTAFRAIVEVHQERVYRLALGLTRNEHDAEDVVQEVFLRAYRSLDAFRGDARLSTWLYRITVNTAHAAARRRSVRATDPLTTDDGIELPVAEGRPAANPERALESRAAGAAIRAAVSRLSEAERTVFVLRHEADLPLAEIARATGRAGGTVRNLLFRALRKLRRELAVYADARPTEVKP